MSELAVSEITTYPRRSTPENITPQSAGRILIIDDEAEIRERWRLFYNSRVIPSSSPALDTKA